MMPASRLLATRRPRSSVSIPMTRSASLSASSPMSLTLAEVAARTGLSVAAVRKRYIRKSLSGFVSNDDGMIRINITEAELEEMRVPVRVDAQGVDAGTIASLVASLSVVASQITDGLRRERDAVADRNRLAVELAAALEREQAGSRERQLLADQIAAERVAGAAASQQAAKDVAAIRADLERLTAELAAARRPWYRKIIG